MLQAAAICYFINGLYLAGMSNINAVMIDVVKHNIKVRRSYLPIREEIIQIFIGDYLCWK